MSSALGQTVITVVRAALVQDSLDNTSYRDWANATRTTYSGCMIQPFQLSSKLQIEKNLDREFSAAYFRVWMPAGADVVSTDRLETHGLSLDVYGFPGSWFDLEDVESHVAVLCYVRKG